MFKQNQFKDIGVSPLEISKLNLKFGMDDRIKFYLNKCIISFEHILQKVVFKKLAISFFI